jgi:MFS superfamily sulfate permease-like transporter
MIMGAVFGLINIKTPQDLIKTEPVQAVIWFATFIVTLTAGLQVGILTGVILSFTAHGLRHLGYGETPTVQQGEKAHEG